LRLAKEAQAKRFMEQQWAREEAKKSRYGKIIGLPSQSSFQDNEEERNQTSLPMTTTDPEVELEMNVGQISEAQDLLGVEVRSEESIAESTRLEAEAKNLEELEASVSAERSLAEQRAFEDASRRQEQSGQARRVGFESQTRRLELWQAEDEDRRRRNEATSASPLARVLAREYGLDLSCIVGTGRGGRVTADDVRNSLPPERVLPLKNSTTKVKFYNHNAGSYDEDYEDESLVDENDVNGKHNFVEYYDLLVSQIS
jgi:pyruvate/2-oxoglutarate dehydrogenase complex dihydrolipoamide acyltransferase (E2) component